MVHGIRANEGKKLTSTKIFAHTLTLSHSYNAVITIKKKMS